MTSPSARRLSIVALLKARNAPHVLTSAQIAALARNPDASTANRITGDLVEQGILVKAMRGLYFNALSPYEVPDILPYLVPPGALSLGSVLGDAGVTNNPSYTLHVVIPMPTPGVAYGFRRNDRQLEDGTRVMLYSMPQRLLEFGIEHSRGYNRAEPEKALCDWLYLARSPRSRVGEVPDDVDLELLNTQKLERYAEMLGIRDALDALRQRIEDAEHYHHEPQFF